MHTTITELRANMSETIGKVRHGGERCIIEKNGKPAAAIISIQDLEYLEAIEAAEDAEDLRILEERKDEETISWDEAKKELGL